MRLSKFVLTVLVLAFILTAAEYCLLGDHDCAGDDCAVCTFLSHMDETSAVGHTPNTLTFGLSPVLALILFGSFILTGVAVTPVLRHDKLSD